MTFHTCRFCKADAPSNFVKYGVRHYAHLACLVKAFTPDALEALFRKMPKFPLQTIPYIEAQRLGILPMLHRVIDEKDRAK